MDTILDNIIDRIPYFIFWKNRDLVYDGCNQRFASLVGKNSPNEIIGKTDYDLDWGVGEPEFYRQGDLDVMSGKQRVNIEEILVRPDGSEIVMLVSKVPIRDSNDNCLGILGISTDITERKKREEELKIANERIEQLNKTLKLYAASQAHELRTPLATIAMQVRGFGANASRLLEGYNMAKDAGLDVPAINRQALELLPQVIATVETEVQLSNAIINSTLSQINLYDKKIPLDQQCSMQTCVQEALARHPFMSEKERKLVEFDSKEDFMFLGSHTLMVHVLFNLIKNALHYIAKNDRGNITITIEKQGEKNVLVFTDTAEGIKSENLTKIFEEFYSERDKGTGVGLAFCKNVVEKMNGTIQCESEYGKYASFIISFPKV